MNWCDLPRRQCGTIPLTEIIETGLEMVSVLKQEPKFLVYLFGDNLLPPMLVSGLAQSEKSCCGIRAEDNAIFLYCVIGRKRTRINFIQMITTVFSICFIL